MRGTSSSECSGDIGKAAIQDICLQTDAGAQCRVQADTIWPHRALGSIVTNGCVMGAHSMLIELNAGGNADAAGLSAGNKHLPHIRLRCSQRRWGGTDQRSWVRLNQ
jgi:hypothetical protein